MSSNESHTPENEEKKKSEIFINIQKNGIFREI